LEVLEEKVDAHAEYLRQLEAHSREFFERQQLHRLVEGQPSASAQSATAQSASAQSKSGGGGSKAEPIPKKIDHQLKDLCKAMRHHEKDIDRAGRRISRAQSTVDTHDGVLDQQANYHHEPERPTAEGLV
jgi:hypothetical protein